MLILTRRPGENIMIKDDIIIKIISAHPRQIRIGIEAPKDVPIYREELYNKIMNIKEDKELSEQKRKKLIEELKRRGEFRNGD